MGERFLDHQCGMTSHQECIETCGIPRAPAELPSHHLFTGRRKDGCKGNFRKVVSKAMPAGRRRR